MVQVLIVGAPRSGTTWIGKTLSHTAGSNYVHEPDGTGDPFASKAKVDLPFTPVLQGDEQLPDYERLWAGAFAGGRRPRTTRDRVARRLYAQVTAAEKMKARRTGDVAWRLRGAHAAAVPLAPDLAARNVIVKSVHAPLALEWIAQRFDPAVLVVRRHPYNVLASRLEMGFAPGPRDVQAAAELAAQAWGVEPVHPGDPALLRSAFQLGVILLAMQDALDRHPSWHSVNHEDLCVAPVDGFSEIASQLDLEWTADSEAFLRQSNREGTGYVTSRIAEDQPERWRERLTPEQVSTIDKALARFPDRLWSGF